MEFVVCQKILCMKVLLNRIDEECILNFDLVKIKKDIDSISKIIIDISLYLDVFENVIFKFKYKQFIKSFIVLIGCFNDDCITSNEQIKKSIVDLIEKYIDLIPK